MEPLKTKSPCDPRPRGWMWDQRPPPEGKWSHLSVTDTGGQAGGAKAGIPNKELVCYALEALEGLISTSEY